MRICSLLPSATDIVLSLGLEDRLVAVTHECDLPETARVPVITRSTMGSGSHRSRDIHNHVTQSAHTGSSLYALDQELLARLDPDIILTQELCDVCAISYDEVRKAVHRLDPAGLEGKRTILSLEPKTLDGILDTIAEVGEVTGAGERAMRLVESLRERIDRVAAAAAGAAGRPRVYCMEWLDPLYTAGHWVPEMVRLAGGEDRLASEGAPSAEISWEAIARYDPEVIVLMPCSFDVTRTIAEFRAIERPAEWSRLEAVRSGRVYVVDSGAYFSRSGPRIVDGLEILGEIVHPEIFPRKTPLAAWKSV